VTLEWLSKAAGQIMQAPLDACYQGDPKCQGKFAPTKHSNADRFPGYKESHFPPILYFASSLLLRYFFLSIDISIVPRRLALYTKTLNDECRVTLFFSTPCPSLPYHD
jgi:hypothetical protein